MRGRRGPGAARLARRSSGSSRRPDRESGTTRRVRARHLSLRRPRHAAKAVRQRKIADRTRPSCQMSRAELVARRPCTARALPDGARRARPAIVLATFAYEHDTDEIGLTLELSAGNVRVMRHRALASSRPVSEVRRDLQTRFLSRRWSICGPASSRRRRRRGSPFRVRPMCGRVGAARPAHRLAAPPRPAGADPWTARPTGRTRPEDPRHGVRGGGARRGVLRRRPRSAACSPSRAALANASAWISTSSTARPRSFRVHPRAVRPARGEV